MAPVRVVRAFRIPITAIITALALSGCMRTTGPVAVAPQGDLDSMAYGQANSPPPQVVVADSGGGAISALRAAFAAGLRAAPAPVVVATPVAYVEPAPGQYPYVPNMTVESAVAIAGGFSPRALRDRVTVTHTDASGTARFVVPPGSPISPGDTVLVSERWF